MKAQTTMPPIDDTRADDPGTMKAMEAKLSSVMDSMKFTKAHKILFLLTTSGVFFDILEQDTIGIIGPVLQEDWGISTSQIALLTSTTFFTMMIGGLLSGVLADRYGRKTMLTINFFIYGAGALLCALAPNYGLLLAARALVGFGLGGELSSAITIMSEYSPTKHRGSAVAGMNIAGGGLGNLLAPLYGMLVLGPWAMLIAAGTDSWRWVFAFLVLPVLLVAVFRRYMPETPRFLLSRGRIDECNRSLTLLKQGRLVPRTMKIESEQFFDTGARTSLTSERIRLSELLARPWRSRAIALTIMTFAQIGGQTSILVLMPTILVHQGYTVIGSIGYTAVMQSGSVLGAVAATLLGRYVNRRTVIGIALLGAALSAIAFGTLFGSLALVLIFGSVLQFFMILLSTTLYAWYPEVFPTRIRAFGVGAAKSVGTLGAVIMPPVAGAIFDAAGLVPIFVMISVFLAIAFIASRTMPETRGRSLEEVNELKGEAMS